MILNRVIVTTNPINGKFQGMMACPVMDGNSLEGLTSFIHELNFFYKIVYRLRYFKPYNYGGSIFVETKLLDKTLKILQEYNLSSQVFGYDNNYSEVKLMLTTVDMTVVRLAT